MRWTHDQVIFSFLHGLGDRQGSALACRGDEIFWNGGLVAIRRDMGNGIPFLINGDRFTSGWGGGWGGRNEQNEVIYRCRPSVQIPFSALRGPGLIENPNYGRRERPVEGLKVIEHRSDTYWNECSVCGKRARHVPVDGSEKDRYSYEWRHFQEEVVQRWGKTPEKVLDPLCEGATALSKHLLGGVLFKHKRRYFLSSVDSESPWNYFLTELPAPATGINEAYFLLRPKELQGLEKIPFLRQGEIFLVPKPEASFSKEQIKRNPGGHVRIFNGRHFATQVVEVKNGKGLEVFVRGTLRHATQGNWGSWGSRRPDHKMVRMGETWHLALKNQAKGSWTSFGGVD